MYKYPYTVPIALEGYFGEREYNFCFFLLHIDPKGFFIRPLPLGVNNKQLGAEINLSLYFVEK